MVVGGSVLFYTHYPCLYPEDITVAYWQRVSSVLQMFVKVKLQALHAIEKY